MQPEAPKFIRDHLNIDDIPGTRPIKRKHLDIQTRDVMKVSDIEGTSSKPMYPVVKERRGVTYNSMDYRDVTHNQF